VSICVETIRAAAKNPELKESEIKALQDELRKRARVLQANNAGLSANEALLKAGQDFAKNAELQALAQKRNRLLSIERRKAIHSILSSSFKGDYANGLKALIVGVQSGKKFGRMSADAEITALSHEYSGKLMADLSRVDGGIDLIVSGEMDDEIAEVLWRLNTDGAELTGLDPRAIGIGKAVHKWQEIARVQANEAGAWIGRTPGWIVTQSHASNKITADREGWMAMMRDRADLGRMMAETDADDIDTLLGSIYDGLASGIHLKSPGGAGEAQAKGLKGMARGLSHDRTIHFKSAADWLAYNKAFGEGTLMEAINFGLMNTARATGLMRVWGPNHTDTYQRVVADLLASMRPSDPTGAAKLKADAKSVFNRYMTEVDGTTNLVGSNPGATLSQGIRGVQGMASLGASTLASVGDLGTITMGARHVGGGALEAVAGSVKALFHGAPSAERLEALADMGAVMESLSGKLVTQRFAVDADASGVIGAMQKRFFRWNLQNRWTDSMRMAAAEFMGLTMARRAGEAFGALPDAMRLSLTQYGIDEALWDVFRKGAMRDVDGRKMLTPSAALSATDDALKPLLTARGQSATPRNLDKMRAEIERKFRLYFTDQNGYMMLMPDAAVRGQVKQGTHRGTVPGEGLRFIMQFKSFPLAYTNRIIGREIMQGFKQGGVSGGLFGVGRVAATSILFGYAAMTLKDLAKGKEPRDPFDAGTIGAAMTHGGGAGIFGDILTSQVTNRGQDAGIALLGPTASDVLGSQGLAGIAARAAEGRDPSAAATRFVTGNTPFLNLFYTRLALEWAVLWNLQEWSNPGSLRRMEREMQERTGQEYLISPSRDRLQLENSP
jgi:hypothetical protein